MTVEVKVKRKVNIFVNLSVWKRNSMFKNMCFVVFGIFLFHCFLCINVIGDRNISFILLLLVNSHYCECLYEYADFTNFLLSFPCFSFNLYFVTIYICWAWVSLGGFLILIFLYECLWPGSYLEPCQTLIM